MFTILSPFITLLIAILLILQFFTFVAGQENQVTIKINSGQRISADIRGVLPRRAGVPARYIWFLNDYAGLQDLAGRLSRIDLYDDQGYLVARRKPLAGERLSIGGFSGFSYSVDLTPRDSRFAAGHVSWTNRDGGVLFLDDMLPQGFARTAIVKLELPPGWHATSTDYVSSVEHSTPSAEAMNVLTVTDIAKGVIFIGREGRRRVVWSGKARLVLNLRDEWNFDMDDALGAAGSIFAEYEKSFGTASTGSFLIGISKFPNPVGSGHWEASTRGRTVNIVSSDMPFKSQSIQRLHEQLRHELFHFWIPNGVNLSGNYDWFYEGFALYSSLKLGVTVNRLRFEDFLATLGGAYDLDASILQRRSLVDGANNRWSASNEEVYARGMLLAFLCDVAMIDASNGRQSVTELIKGIVAKHGLDTPRVDGNAAIIAAFKARRELAPMADRYITGRESFDIGTAFSLAGIEIDPASRTERLKVSSKLTGRQKKLLDKLGINNWRKINEK